jgi:hypothetical protein
MVHGSKNEGRTDGGHMAVTSNAGYSFKVPGSEFGEFLRAYVVIDGVVLVCSPPVNLFDYMFICQFIY